MLYDGDNEFPPSSHLVNYLPNNNKNHSTTKYIILLQLHIYIDVDNCFEAVYLQHSINVNNNNNIKFEFIYIIKN